MKLSETAQSGKRVQFVRDEASQARAGAMDALVHEPTERSDNEVSGKLNAFSPGQKGQGLTEYAVILSLIAVASIAATSFFGGAIKGKIASLAGAISGQSAAEVDASDKKSIKAAKQAQKNAEKVHGNTSIHKNVDIFDTESL